MGCMGFTWSNQEGNLVIHAGVAYSIIFSGISGEQGIFSFAFPVCARLRPYEIGSTSNLSWKTLSCQYTAAKGSCGETHGLTAAGEPWRHHLSQAGTTINIGICVVMLSAISFLCQGEGFVLWSSSLWRVGDVLGRSHVAALSKHSLPRVLSEEMSFRFSSGLFNPSVAPGFHIAEISHFYFRRNWWWTWQIFNILPIQMESEMI